MLLKYSCFILLNLAWSVTGRDGFMPSAVNRTVSWRGYSFNEVVNGWLKLHIVPTTWENAKKLCYLEGGRLASPINESFYSEMRMLMESTHTKMIFTGIHTNHTENDYYSEEGVHFTDMTLFWAEDEPNNLNDQERCLAMMRFGEMADVKCDKLHRFICYNENLTLNECGNNDYKKYDDTGSCYKYHSTEVTWEQASAICKAEGGYLAIVESEEEAKTLNKVVMKAIKDISNLKRTLEAEHVGYYRGRFEGCSSDRWKTVDGKMMKIAWFWSPGQPDQSSHECCGAVRLQNDRVRLHDYPCNALLNFICEMDNIKNVGESKQ